MPRITHALDTSALIVYLREEPGHERFVELLKQEGSYFAMHIVNLGELYCFFWRSAGENEANEAWSKTTEMPIRIMDSVSESFIKRVGRWRAKQGTPYADAFVLATAEEYGVPLVTTDHQHFDPVNNAGLIEFCFLR